MVFYDDNAYPNDGYENSSTILEKETKEARQKAKAEYSKEKHLAFLISDYFENVMRDLNRVKEIKKRIEDKYDVENAKKIIYEFKGEITEHIIESINQYNNSTIV